MDSCSFVQNEAKTHENTVFFVASMPVNSTPAGGPMSPQYRGLYQGGLGRNNSDGRRHLFVLPGFQFVF